MAPSIASIHKHRPAWQNPLDYKSGNSPLPELDRFSTFHNHISSVAPAASDFFSANSVWFWIFLSTVSANYHQISPRFAYYFSRLSKVYSSRQLHCNSPSRPLSCLFREPFDAILTFAGRIHKSKHVRTQLTSIIQSNLLIKRPQSFSFFNFSAWVLVMFFAKTS